MKKLILSLAILLGSGAAVTAMAQTSNTSATECQKKECKAPQGECKKADRPCPFDNLNLTDAQKTKIKELQEANKAKKEAAREQAKADREKAKAERPDFKAERQNYLNSIKSILTPEQYVQFLENSYLEQGMKGGKPGFKGGKDCKNDCKKDCKKGGKGFKKGAGRPDRQS